MSAPMGVEQMLAGLASRGIELWLDDEQVRYRGPEGAVTPAVLAELRGSKAEIVAWLKAEQERPFPLTSGQRALWFLHQVDPASPAYHIRFTVELAPGANAERIDAAMRQLAERHPVLRTCFRLQDGVPVQFVQREIEWRLRVRELAADERPEAEADEPFDLEHGPVCRVTLFRRADGSQVLQISAHHIAFDYAALEILITELRALYEGRGDALPALRATFRTHAEAETRRLAADEGERLRRYWQTTLAGRLPVLELPFARPRPAKQTWHGETYQAFLSSDLTAQLRELARAEGTTLYSVMLAAWQVLLFRHTHDEDLIVGTPLSGRGSEYEGVVGYFANAIPIRTRFASRMTFRQLLEETRQCVLSAVEHGEYPLATMLEDLQIERDPARSPLFQTTFVWDQRNDGLAPGYAGDSLYTSRFTSEQRGANYDLSLTIYDIAGPLRMALAYNRDLFDAGDIASLAERFEQLLRSAVADSEVLLDHAFMEPALKITSLPSEGTSEPSFHQKRIRFIDQFETGKVYPSAPTYHNLIGYVELDGEADARRLHEALRRLVSRHSVLGGASGDVQLRVDAWTEDAIERERARPFQREHELPVRGVLFAKENSTKVLALVAHHYAVDAWTVRLLLEEWVALYQGATLPEALQYAQYVARQYAMAGGELNVLRRYWFHVLRGQLQPLVLPYDHPRAPIHIYRAGVVNCRLDAKDASELRFLAAFVALLRRYSGQEEIVLGVADAGRENFASMAGPVSNLLVLRPHVNEATTFLGLEQQARELLTAAREHREMPFDRLVTELNPPKDMSRTALFDVLFSYHDHADSAVEVSPAGFGKYDLHLVVSRNTKGVQAQLVFNRELFDEPTAEAMARHWSRLVNAFANGASTVDEVELPEDYESRFLPLEQVGWPVEENIVSLFRKSVERFPNRTAVSFGERTLTYRELDERSNHLAARLIASGVQSEELVALFLDRDELLPVAVLGVLKTGAAYLPIDPAIPASRMEFIVRDAECSRAVVSTSRVDVLPAGLKAFLLSSMNGEQSAGAPNVDVRGENLAYCIYTSGSTGQPKGVLLEHRQVVRLFFNDAPLFDFNEEDVWTLFHSYSFDFSVWEIFGALLFGGRLVIVPAETATDAAAMMELLRDEQVTVLNQTPPAFGPLAEECVRQKPALALRMVIFGGQRLDPVKLQAFHRLYPQTKLINMYGITETCVHVTYREITAADMESPFSPIGRPIPTLHAYVVDAQLRPVPRGVTGELLVGGAGLARGYLNRPELTQERFIPHPLLPDARLYRSGDLVRELANGGLVYEGRADEQVQVRGFRVELGEIRRALLKQPVVADVHVSPRGSDNEAQIVAWVAPRVDFHETERRLAKYRREAPGAEWARFELPNGMVIATRNPSETEFTYDEIFEQNSYLRHGVHLPDGATVIDAGANIGMFSLFAATVCRDARVIALEPIPQTAAILRVNAGLYDFRIEVQQCGVASREQIATFTYYPNVSIFSGRFADAEQEREIIRTYIRNQAQQSGEAAPSDAEIETILLERFQGKAVECRLRTISQIIHERGLERVDLLKLDVERSELDALRGVEENDWPKIRQIVIETHGGAGETEEIAELLRSRGFNVALEQEEALEDTIVCNLFAVRGQGSAADTTHIPTRANPLPNSAPALVRELRTQLRRELPEYMIPCAIVLMDALPLTANGKVDTANLPSPDRAAAATAEFIAPRNEVEEQIAAIWHEVLGVPKVGAFDSFFDLGGHSLLVMRVISRLRAVFGVEFPVHAMFENPTVAGVAETLQQLQAAQPDDLDLLLAELEELSEEEATDRLSSLSATHVSAEPGGAA